MEGCKPLKRGERGGGFGGGGPTPARAPSRTRLDSFDDLDNLDMFDDSWGKDNNTLPAISPTRISSPRVLSRTVSYDVYTGAVKQPDPAI